VFGEDFYESSKSAEVATLLDDDPNLMSASQPRTRFISSRICTLFIVKLCVSAHHNLLWGNKAIVLLFLTLDTKLRLVVSFTPRPLYP